MQIRKWIPGVTTFLIVVTLAACAPSAATQAPPATMATMPASLDVMPMEGYAGGAEAQKAYAAPTAMLVQPANPEAEPIQNAGYADHMIVKNGDVKLLVKDSDRALDGVTQIVGDVHGYIVSSRVWYQDHYGTNYKYATLTMSVPVDQFETSLRRLRGLAVRVLDENASGEDVTDQYVDLQSQVTNLEATRDRIKSFLDDAKTVDEALRINQQLSEVEAQIEKLKGQMNYLSDRSAFSTITVNLEPELPEIVMTPTPTPTPSPIEPLGPWDPSRTTQRATNALVSAYRVVVDLLIWVFVVLLPIFGPPALLLWLVIWLIRRRAKPAPKQ